MLGFGPIQPLLDDPDVDRPADDGSRRVTGVTGVAGMEGATVSLQDVFVFEQEPMSADPRVRGELRATGIRRAFADRFARFGVADVSVEPSLS